MLQAIRDKTTGWIAYAIIFLISVPFALWGVNSYLGGGEVAPAATVNGQEISVRDFDRAYANYRQRLAQVFGGTIPTGFGDDDLLKNQVLTQLIEEFVLRQYTLQQRYRIGDQQLGELIRSEQAFQSDGRFEQSIYQSQLASLGYSSLGYEQEYRQNRTMSQLQTAINATAFTVPECKRQFASLASQTRKIRRITRTINTEVHTPGEVEIEDYYAANTNRYRTVEQLRIDYLEVSLDGIKSLVEVEDDQVLDRYQQSKDSYTSTESRTASHILFTLDEGASDEDRDQVLARILDVREQIVANDNFASLAREFSQDPGSAADGGYLGEIEPGMMVQPFEVALFQMQVGELSDPVKTAFGWHLIKLDQISGGETRTFEDVRTEIEDEIRSDLAENQIFDIVDNLANMAYEQSDSLLPAAEQLGLQLQTSEWFDRNTGTGIASEPQVRSIAFSSEVLGERINSEAIELSDNRVVFIRLNELQPAQQMPLDKVRQVIIGELKREKARNDNIRLGKQALEALQSGKSLDQVAADWGLEIVDNGFVGRDSAGIDRELLQLVFSMDKPEQGPVFEGLTQANGDYSLVELSGVLSNNFEIDSESLEALTAATATADYQSILKVLAGNADIVRTPLSALQ
ncbi:MAG: SurA N-terminal domain-containing protein [Gammaproteobacteria bacterium]|nr:SurA N-terminal domain-containing protein [Gammaproteobacteria bacterium]